MCVPLAGHLACVSSALSWEPDLVALVPQMMGLCSAEQDNGDPNSENHKAHAQICFGLSQLPYLIPIFLLSSSFGKVLDSSFVCNMSLFANTLPHLPSVGVPNIQPPAT